MQQLLDASELSPALQLEIPRQQLSTLPWQL
jgi:hypothetical protein